MKNQWSIGLLTAAALSCGASASISTYTSDISQIGSETNYADFNELVVEQSLLGYQEDGLQVSSHRDYFSWDAPGLDGSEMYYANTGALELIEISKVDGSDFNDMDMQLSSGWSPNGPGTMYLWMQVYSDGGLVAEFNLDVLTGDYVGLTGGGYDTVMIGSYVSAEVRDLHDADQWNAIAIDNLRAGTVPAPGTLLIPALAAAGLRRRRA